MFIHNRIDWAELEEDRASMSQHEQPIKLLVVREYRFLRTRLFERTHDVSSETFSAKSSCINTLTFKYTLDETTQSKEFCSLSREGQDSSE